MAVKIKIIRATDFLQVSPEGELDLDASRRLLVAVASAKRPPADFEVLLDLREVEWDLSTTDIWSLAKELGRHGETFRDKLAVLAAPGEAFDQAEFFELCSQNRGYRVEAFSSFEEAIQWLFPAVAVQAGEPPN